jgi:hypothetical protein
MGIKISLKQITEVASMPMRFSLKLNETDWWALWDEIHQIKKPCCHKL